MAASWIIQDDQGRHLVHNYARSQFSALGAPQTFPNLSAAADACVLIRGRERNAGRVVPNVAPVEFSRTFAE